MAAAVTAVVLGCGRMMRSRIPLIEIGSGYPVWRQFAPNTCSCADVGAQMRPCLADMQLLGLVDSQGI